MAIIKSIPNFKLHKIRSCGQRRLDGWNNMLILGDNLKVLKTLLGENEILEQVRLVYIDPPFSTNQEFKIGNLRTSTVSWSAEDENAYEDKLNGPEYLEFLKSRLVLLRQILAEDGSIYIHIDCKVGHYVKVLIDGIFGQDRFINDITRVKCNSKNFKRKGYGNIKDMIFFYSKTNNFVWNEPREEIREEDIKKMFPKIDKDGRRYSTTPLHAPGETQNGATGQPWKGLKPSKGRHWRKSPDELDKLDRMTF